MQIQQYLEVSFLSEAILVQYNAACFSAVADLYTESASVESNENSTLLVGVIVGPVVAGLLILVGIIAAASTGQVMA